MGKGVRKSVPVFERVGGGGGVPLLVGLFELIGYDFAPPFKAWGRGFLGEGAVDEAAVKVECGDLCGKLRIAVDAVEAGTFWAEGRRDPTEDGVVCENGRGSISGLIEYGKH